MDAHKCDVCRLCLGSINGCDEILLNNNQYLTNSIFLITGLEVVSDSGQCEYLCDQCQTFLEQCVDFRITCINNDGVFRKMLAGSKLTENCKSEIEKPKPEYIKQEPVDLGVTADDVNEEWKDNNIIPHEFYGQTDEQNGSSNEDNDVYTELSEPKCDSEMSQCDRCGNMVEYNQLNEHQETHNSNHRKLYCSHCPKDFANIKLLKQHKKAHHANEMQCSCDQCGKLYTNRNSLNEHYKRKHNGRKRHACSDCGERFTTLSERMVHQRMIHSSVRTLTTRSNTRKKRNDLIESTVEITNREKDGKRVPTSHPIVKCNQCGIMIGLYAYKKHLETHNPDRQKSRCPHCPKEYIDACLLKRHIVAKHTREIQHTCDACGKSYVSLSTLNEHFAAVHRGEKRYPCSVCGKKFTRMSSRSYHQRTAHSTARPFACEYCQKTFKTRGDLNNHFRFHSKKKSLNHGLHHCDASEIPSE